MSEIPYHAYDKTGTFKPPGYSDGLTKINHVTKTDPGEITRVEVPNPTPPADSLEELPLDEFLFSVLPNRLIRLLDEDKFYAQIEQLDQTIKSWVAAHDRRRDEARLQAIKDTPEYRNTGYSALKAAIDRVYSNTSTEAGK
jgi:hypothetical protein